VKGCFQIRVWPINPKSTLFLNNPSKLPLWFKAHAKQFQSELIKGWERHKLNVWVMDWHDSYLYEKLRTYRIPIFICMWIWVRNWWCCSWRWKRRGREKGKGDCFLIFLLSGSEKWMEWMFDPFLTLSYGQYQKCPSTSY
jgi:hypothetical protein